MMWGHDVPIAVTTVGSLTALGAGMVSFATEGPSYNPALIVAFGGLVTAIGGLIGSVGNQLVTAFRIWSDQRKAERKAELDARTGLIELRSMLKSANREIERLNQIIREGRECSEQQKQLIVKLIELRRGDVEAFVGIKARQLESETKDDPAEQRIADLKSALEEGIKRLSLGVEADTGDDLKDDPK